MSAQIEREPRAGVELAERWTWRDYAAMALSYALIAALGLALTTGDLTPVVCLLLATALFLILTAHHQEQDPMNKRIYVVNGGEQQRLVRAGNRSAAISHVVRTTYTAAVASQDNIVTALGQGIKVEDAGAEDGEGGGE